MYKLVIIEDELMVRRNIIRKIEWNKYGFEVAGQAENGKEGLEVIEAVNPHVVITDIEMPFMNGLELSAIVREKYPSIKVVLLTGFDEFKYAQQAIKLNVMEYILKPLSSENLIKVLMRIKALIDEEVEKMEDIATLKEYYQQSLPVMRMSFLNSLVTYKLDKVEILDKCKNLDIDLQGDKYIVSVISIDRKTVAETKFCEKDEELIRFAVLNTTEEICEKYKSGIPFYHDAYVVIIFSYREVNEKDARDKLYKSLEEIRQNIEKYMKFTVTIGIGTLCSELAELSSSFKSAVAALGYRFVLGNNRIIYIGDLEPESFSKIVFDDKKEQLLSSGIKTGQKEDVEKAVEDIFKQISGEKSSFNDYQVYLLEVLSVIIKITKGLNIDTKEVFGANSNLFTDTFQFTSVSEVKEWVKELCNKIMNHVSDRRVNSCKLFVEKAKTYILEHYNNGGLSLNDVSNYLHISPNYFGSIFKNETGETFVNFLLKVRMEKAKDLICTSDMKNFEIADKVGYVDQHYFSYCFKKYYNCSPNEFRHSLSKK